jgi:hypothetical protein
MSQYVRGTLFTYTDYLMGCADFEDADIAEVFDFFKSVTRLIVAWMKKIPSLTTSIDELNQIP